MGAMTSRDIWVVTVWNRLDDFGEFGTSAFAPQKFQLRYRHLHTGNHFQIGTVSRQTLPRLYLTDGILIHAYPDASVSEPKCS